MEDMKDKVIISRRDLYCIARLLQSEKYAHEPFKACQYCKYPCSTEDELLPNYEHVLFGLQDMTGVDFGVGLKSTEKRMFNVRPVKTGNDFSTMGITAVGGKGAEIPKGTNIIATDKEDFDRLSRKLNERLQSRTKGDKNMKISAKEINIEVTPEELALLLAPGECIPAMQDETEDGEKEINIHANIFMPPEMPDEITFHMDNGSDANQKAVSESDTKAKEENANISEAEGREILEILAEGLAHNRNGHLVSVGFGRNKEMSEEFECEDGRRFKVTMRRI